MKVGNCLGLGRLMHANGQNMLLCKCNFPNCPFGNRNAILSGDRAREKRQSWRSIVEIFEGSHLSVVCFLGATAASVATAQAYEMRGNVSIMDRN